MCCVRAPSACEARHHRSRKVTWICGGRLSEERRSIVCGTRQRTM